MKKHIFLMITYLFISLFAYVSCEKDKKEELPGNYKLKNCLVDQEDLMQYFYNDSLQFDRLFIPSFAHGFDFFISRHYTQLPYVYQSYYKEQANNKLLLKLRGWENVDSVFLNENLAISPFSQQNELELIIKKRTKTELVFETTYLNKIYYYEFEKE